MADSRTGSPESTTPDSYSAVGRPAAAAGNRETAADNRVAEEGVVSWILQSRGVSWREAVLTIPERTAVGISNEKTALGHPGHDASAIDGVRRKGGLTPSLNIIRDSGATAARHLPTGPLRGLSRKRMPTQTIACGTYCFTAT